MLQNAVLTLAEVISSDLQGSFLRPILFLIYINDIPGVCVLTSKLFADDNKL